MRATILATAVFVAICGVTASAHHSGAMFEDTKVIEVSGIVKEFQYTNPHSLLIVEVTNEDGSVSTWGFEAEGPSTLQRAGIRKNDFPPGTKITIRGNPMKDGRTAAAWIDAVVDGKTINPRKGFAVLPAAD